MSANRSIEELETQLNSFIPEQRFEALHALAEMAQKGAVDFTPETQIANMHCHSFFSFNAYGYSPSGLAWLGRRRGFAVMGTVDFDVLDAVGEFLQACEIVGQRGSAGIESRVFVPEFSTREMNSPGEPGVLYHMGIGFVSGQVPESSKGTLLDLRQRAERRNRDMAERLNAFTAPVHVDYDQDVLPLTPAGNATERHMLVAYSRAAEGGSADPDTFWAEKLGLPREQVSALRPNTAAFNNTVRGKLMKKGGAGYVQPGPASFPTVEEFHSLITACEALPCAAWLDGASKGEQDIEELLELLISKGVVALNIIPDRNWNFKDPEVRKVKVDNLYRVVDLAARLDLPLNIGTEMNAPGQKLVDDFNAPELAPVRDAFMNGAYFIYGHTVLQKAARLGYMSNWAVKHFPTRAQRNDFYTKIGKLAAPGKTTITKLQGLTSSASPEEIIGCL
jgi:hypothetical protein